MESGRKPGRPARASRVLIAAAALAGLILGARGAAAQPTTFWPFQDTDGSFPLAGLLISNDDSALWGTTQRGGDYGQGTLFRLDLAASGPTVLHSFDLFNDGGQPAATVTQDAAGNFYGTAYGGGAFGAGTVWQLDPSNTLTVLHNFAGGSGDGANPQASLIADADLNLYGTTTYGGTSNLGTVFQITPSGNLTVLYNFSGNPDGAYPSDRLVEYAGNFFGTTANGGASGAGTVFQLAPNGDGTYSETVLYSFTGGSDGAFPLAALIVSVNGIVFGTTSNGAGGNGTVFAFNTVLGDFSVLHSFSGADGAVPYASLIYDAAGNLYGTTRNGGGNGLGTVFKLAPNADGTYSETVLYSFSDFGGKYPYARLIFDSTASNLYGTTYEGGDLTKCGGFGCGTVFQLPLAGASVVGHRG